MDPAILRDVHDFWFGTLAGPHDFPEDKAPMWFRQSDATDALIRERFAAALEPAAAAAWDVPVLAPAERVGLVVLLDQFPRNLFRTSGDAFRYDLLARRHADAAIACGLDDYALVERSFLGLPFEHSENLADQDRAVAFFEDILNAAPAGQKERYAEMLEYAVRHRDLILRFHRFPHRNAVLGRASTPEEVAFLAEHGRGY